MAATSMAHSRSTDGWKGEKHIGPPIPRMLARLKAHLAAGDTVKIVTARVGSEDPEEVAFNTKVIQAYWLGTPRPGPGSDVQEGLWDDHPIR
jgi:hypothetical protein